jgi:hypothetical protein
VGNTKIQIIDSDNGIEGNLELKESNNFPLSLTIKSGDIAQLSTRSGTFSTSFDIPQTKENNKLLGSLYYSQVKNTKEYFVKKDAIILVDENVFQRGKIRIEQVNKETYKAVFFGDNAEWIPLLKDVYLSDIGYDSTVTLTGTNIANTFTNTSASDEYVMNYVNRGANRTWANRTYTREFFPTGEFASSDWNFSMIETQNIAHVEEFNADLFLKQILNKSFNSIGYNFESDFFDADGSALIHSYISDNYKKQDTESNYVEATLSADSSATFSVYSEYYGYDVSDSVVTRYMTIPFDTETTDANNNFNNSTNKFTAPREGYYDFEIDLDISSLEDSTGINFSTEFNSDLKIALWKDNTSDYNLEAVGKNRLFSTIQNPVNEFEDYGQVKNTLHLYSADGSLYIDAEKTDSFIDFRKTIHPFNDSKTLTTAVFTAKLSNVYLLEGDICKFIAVLKASENLEATDTDISINIASGATLRITERTNLVRNNTFNLKDIVDSSKHSITDIISDLTKTFNLYWRTDNKVKKVYCEPRNEFYKALVDAKDWTSKIDISDFSLIPLASKFARNLSFKYKEDSKDIYLSERNKQSSENWGAYSHDFGVNFKDGTKSISLNTYTPSYFISPDLNGYGAKEFSVLNYDFTDAPFTSRLWNESSEEITEFEYDFAPRLLNYDYSNTQELYYETQASDKEPEHSRTTNAPVGLFNKITRYGKTVTPKINLSFATLNSQNGLFKNFYNQTFELINEGFLLKIKANLSKTDISNFKINDVIHFSAPYKIAGYWVLESMSNIKPNQGGLVTLSLIQHKAFGVTIEQSSNNTEFTSGSIPFSPKFGGIVSIDNQK